MHTTLVNNTNNNIPIIYIKYTNNNNTNKVFCQTKDKVPFNCSKFECFSELVNVVKMTIL
jgi:hypothetical protein